MNQFDYFTQYGTCLTVLFAWNMWKMWENVRKQGEDTWRGYDPRAGFILLSLSAAF